MRKYARVFGPRWPYLAMAATLCRTPPVVAVRVPGIDRPLCVRLKTSDVDVVVQVFVDREYDFELPREPRVVVDAGANVGFAAIYFANRWPAARVIAIEPEPSNFARLAQNTADLPNITAMHAALWDRAAELSLVDPGTGSWGFQVRGGHPPDDEPAEAKTRGLTLDRLMDELDLERIDLLKVDIEGAEVEVFADPSAWIERVDAIVIELHDFLRPDCARTVYRGTAAFTHRAARGENVLLSRFPLPGDPGPVAGPPIHDP